MWHITFSSRISFSGSMFFYYTKMFFNYKKSDSPINDAPLPFE